MKVENERRIYNTTTAFAFITGLLSFGHIAIIVLSIQEARDLDKQDPRFIGRDLEFWINIPVIAGVGLAAIFQLFSSVIILMFHSRNHSAIRTVYYAAITGMLFSFAIGVYLTIEATQLNAALRTYPKHDGPLPKLMPYYWSQQVGAAVSLLFVFPMMAFTFYHSLEKYLELQKKQMLQKVGNKSQGYFLVLFLLQSASLIACIVNLYMYSDKQDKTDYGLDNAIDVVAFFLAVSAVVQIVLISLQIKNMRNPFLSKKQSIVMAVIVGVFQMGLVCQCGVKDGQLWAQNFVLGDQLCKLEDCEADRIMRWELFGYSIFALFCILMQIPYLKVITFKVDQEDKRDTLLTVEDLVASRENQV